MNLEIVGKKRMFQLNEHEEFHQNAYESLSIYKNKTKAWHDKHLVKTEFQPGQQVLLFNSRLKLFSGKLKSRWLSPFVIMRVFPYGSIELTHLEKGTFKVNGQRVTPYFEGQLKKYKPTTTLRPT